MRSSRSATPNWLLRSSAASACKFNVEVVCTTDDPADDLRWHKQIAENLPFFGTKVLPTWRPDKVMGIEDVKSLNEYLGRLSEAAGIEIRSYSSLV